MSTTLFPQRAYTPGGTDVPITDGGTGASDGPTARTNLGLGTAATLASTQILQVSNNLSDVANAATSRTNLGLGTAAVAATGDFDAAGAAAAVLASSLQKAANLSDVANVTTSRTNLGLGSLATQDSSAVTVTGGTITGVSGLMFTASQTSVDAKIVAITTLYTVPGGKNFVPLGVNVYLTAASGLISAATVSIGTDNPLYGNIFGLVGLAALGTTTQLVLMSANEGDIPVCSAGTDIKLNLTVGAVGTSGTLTVDLLGYFK